MIKNISTTPKDVKFNNQKLIIDSLIDGKEYTRAEIAKIVKASKPTVSKNIEQLIGMGIIIEGGKANNQIGKKGTLLRINKDYVNFLIIDLSMNMINICISNLLNDISVHKSKHLGTVNDIIETLDEVVGRVYDKNIIIYKCIISFPGIVDRNGENIVVNIQENEIRLRKLVDYLRKQLGLEVVCMNDINLAVLAEKKNFFGEEIENLIYLSIGVGVGAGIFVNNQLLIGDTFAASEIGFAICGSENGELSTFEQLVSIDKVLERYTVLTGIDMDYESFKAKYIDGDTACVHIMNEIKKIIAIRIYNAAVLLDIQNVVIGGLIVEMCSEICKDIELIIHKFSKKQIKIQERKLKNASVIGAAIMIRNEWLEDPFIYPQ